MKLHSYLSYCRNSLADSFATARKDDEIKNSVSLKGNLLNKFELPELSNDIFEELYKKAKDGKKLIFENDSYISISVILLPFILRKKVMHGIRKSGSREFYPIVAIPANISKHENQQDNKCSKFTLSLKNEKTPPIIARDFLEPTSSDLVIGSIEDIDKFYTVNPVETWDDCINFYKELMNHIKIPEGFIQLENDICRILVSAPPRQAINIISLYDTLSKKKIDVPLLQQMLEGVNNLPILEHNGLLFTYNKHIGQMGNDNSLSNSQRETLSHFLSLWDKPSTILAVNGPPGTGKTTLIHSVVATIWVDAALKKNPCPLIVASSTNNKAVTNIIESFEKSTKDGINRWIPNISSYGLYMPSDDAAKKAKQKGKEYQLYLSHPTNNNPSEHFITWIEELGKWNEAKKQFFDNFRTLSKIETNSLDDARDYLHKKLTEVVKDNIISPLSLLADLCVTIDIYPFDLTKLKEYILQWKKTEEDISSNIYQIKDALAKANKLKKEWLKHQIEEPFWISILARLGFTGKQKKRDQIFFIEQGLDEFSLVPHNVVESKLDEKIKRLSSEFKKLNDKLASVKENRDTTEKKLSYLSSWCKAEDIDILPKEIYARIDTKYRFQAFNLATHYWEAEFLIETYQLINGSITENKANRHLDPHFRRLAKITPCFVSTLYSLPKWFTGYSNDEKTPLINAIDLLIIDEAGQVSPDTGAASLALAKRALVIGDTFQIEPVWSVTNEGIDKRNAIELDFEKLEQIGATASQGNIMKMAQNASCFSKSPEIGKGMVLTEHYRCVPDIINYCNKLAYKGILIPSRKDIKPKIQLPPIGYAHIEGYDEVINGSRSNEIEAETIVNWIDKRYKEFEDAYGKGIKDIIGVVTPFNIQARKIELCLSKYEKLKNIEVGTVHTFQGGEKPIIFFSPCYGIKHKGNAPFLNKGVNMLNVAVSRAEDHFLVFGNMNLFGNNARRPSSLLGSFLFNSQDNEITDIKPAIAYKVRDEQDSKMLIDTPSHRSFLQNIIKSAAKEIGISSPWIRLPALQSDNIPDIIRMASNRGVKVTVFTDRQSNAEDKNFTACVKELKSVGADIKITKDENLRLHAKALWQDNSILAIGSFNWLSSSRWRYKMSEITVVVNEDASDYIRDVKEALEMVCTDRL